MRGGSRSNNSPTRPQSISNNDNLYILEPIKTVNGQTHMKKYKKIKKVG